MSMACVQVCKEQLCLHKVHLSSKISKGDNFIRVSFKKFSINFWTCEVILYHKQIKAKAQIMPTQSVICVRGHGS